MHFSERKHGRSPLQRLSDQRRSLALAGLAVGAVFSAAFLRRKRRGVEAEFGDPASPAAPPESGPPITAVRPAAEPEVAVPVEVAAPGGPAEATEAAASGPTEATEPATATASDSHPAPLEPATGELSAEEASILAVLAQSGRLDDDRTAIAVATSLERDTAAVTDVLRKLGSEGVVSGELYTAAGDKIWVVTERGVRRLGAQS